MNMLTIIALVGVFLISLCFLALIDIRMYLQIIAKGEKL